MNLRGGGLATLFPIALMALLAGLTLWLDRSTRSGTTRDDGHYRHDPDYFVENLELRRFGKDGMLQHRLSAERMQHYPDDNTTQLIMPTLTYVRTETPTHASADFADVSGDGKLVTMRNNVRVVRDASAQRAELVAETSHMLVWPDDERARTDAPVRIQSGKSVVTGVGMDVDNIELVYRLHHEVRAVMQPGDNR